MLHQAAGESGTGKVHTTVHLPSRRGVIARTMCLTIRIPREPRPSKVKWSPRSARSIPRSDGFAELLVVDQRATTGPLISRSPRFASRA
jgi:hypothetical protein